MSLPLENFKVLQDFELWKPLLSDITFNEHNVISMLLRYATDLKNIHTLILNLKVYHYFSLVTIKSLCNSI